MKLDPNTIAAFKVHALSEFPNECVGVVKGDGTYLALVNTSPYPETEFEADPKALDGALAVLHTHTQNQAAASYTDMEQQEAMGIPWGIALAGKFGISELFWLGSPETQPLKGRNFFHGIHDCYSLIRDYYFQKRRVSLPDFKRYDGWWKEEKFNPKMYETYYTEAGFVKIELSEVTQHDVLLMRIGHTKSINHGGVVLGNGLFLHHLVGRLSVEEPIGMYQRNVEIALRYQWNSHS